MTIPEEIEQLKINLRNTTDEKEQGEVLLKLLKKYTSINRTDIQLYIDCLTRLAEKLNQPVNNAWALYYLAFLNRKKGDNGLSEDLSRQALLLFMGESNQEGIVHCYNSIGIIHNNNGNYPEALNYHLQALQTAENSNDKQGVARSNNWIGTVHYSQGNYPEAMKYYVRSQAIFEQINDRAGMAILYNNIGMIHHAHANHPEALKNYLQALQLREEIGDKFAMASSYNNIGVIYHDQKNHSDALKNYLKALQIFEEIGDKSGLAGAYANISTIYKEQGNYSEAVNNQVRAYEIMNELGNKWGIATTLANIGNTLYLQGNFPQALDTHLRAVKIKEEIGDKHGIALSYNCIGEMYYRQNNYIEALKNLSIALKVSEEIGNKDELKNSWESLSNTYEAMKDFENALKYYEKYQQLETEINGSEVQRQIHQLNSQREVEQKEKDLEIEHLRNLELKKEKDRSENLLLNILPAEAAEELKDNGKIAARLFDDVTVLFTDFKGFTNISERLTPQQLVDELHTCFTVFDEICAKHKVEKIKTIGDAYLAVSGLPLANPCHATDIVKASIEIKDFMLSRKPAVDNPQSSIRDIRIGIHSGSVVAGIVGLKKYAFDIWGDAVNIANLIEQNSEVGKINISETTFQLIKDEFKCTYHGEIEAKNKTRVKMYFING